MSKSKDYIFHEIGGELVFVGDFEGYYQESSDPWGQSATREMGRYYRLSRQRLVEFVECCPNRGEILEVGCGHGHVAQLIAAQFPQSHVTGLDISVTAIDRARAGYPGLAFVAGDIADSDTVSKLATGRFNVIILNQLLWYILDTLPVVLGNVRTLLSDDGCLIISNAFARNQRYGTEIIDHFHGAVRYFCSVEGFYLHKARFDDDGEEHNDGHFLLECR